MIQTQQQRWEKEKKKHSHHYLKTNHWAIYNEER